MTMMLRVTGPTTSDIGYSTPQHAPRTRTGSIELLSIIVVQQSTYVHVLVHCASQRCLHKGVRKLERREKMVRQCVQLAYPIVADCAATERRLLESELVAGVGLHFGTARAFVGMPSALHSAQCPIPTCVRMCFCRFVSSVLLRPVSTVDDYFTLLVCRWTLHKSPAPSHLHREPTKWSGNKVASERRTAATEQQTAVLCLCYLNTRP